MTHNELLSKIVQGEYQARGADVIAWQALRVLVEMHDPIGLVCGWCTCRDCEHIVEAPCKTIKAIEFELQ